MENLTSNPLSAFSLKVTYPMNNTGRMDVLQIREEIKTVLIIRLIIRYHFGDVEMPFSSNTANHVQSNNMAELFAGDYMHNSVTNVTMALPGLKLLLIQL